MRMHTAGLAALATCLLASTAANAAPVTFNEFIAGGGGSTWIIDDARSGGNPDRFMVNDASIPAGADAIDGGFTFNVDGTWYDTTEPLDLTGTTITGNPSVLSGLNVSAQYFIDPASARLRHLITLENPTAGTIGTTVSFQSNLGSDGSTQVDGTSSGDAVFGLDDSWIVTSDGSDGDPALTHVLTGPGSPPVTPSLVALTLDLFESGLEGVRADYVLSIDAGQTVSLLLFGEMTDTAANALANATFWNSVDDVAGAGLLAGLTDTQLASVVNWQFDDVTLPMPVPATAALLFVGLAGLAAGARRRGA